MNIHNTRRKFRSQTSDSWTDAATVVGAVREERSQKRKIQNRRVTRQTAKVPEKLEKSRSR